MYKFWYVNMPNVTAGNGKFSTQFAFFKNYLYIRYYGVVTTRLKRYNFIKLLQSVC